MSLLSAFFLGKENGGCGWKGVRARFCHILIWIVGREDLDMLTPEVCVWSGLLGRTSIQVEHEICVG